MQWEKYDTDWYLGIGPFTFRARSQGSGRWSWSCTLRGAKIDVENTSGHYSHQEAQAEAEQWFLGVKKEILTHEQALKELDA